MGKDVLDDRYGRLFNLPLELSLFTNSMTAVCMDYHINRKLKVVEIDSRSRFYGFFIGSIIDFIKVFNSVIFARHDIVIGSSDCLLATFAMLTAWVYRRPYYLDLYDNYESFGLAKLPGVLWLYRRAVKGAKGICCVSDALADYIRQRYQHPNVITLESTISGGDFIPLNKQACREKLKLPVQGTLIGIAGALDSSRGIDLLYRSFLQLAESDLLLHLVLAGPTDNACPIPAHPRIHYLGMLAHQDIPVFYNALDLAVICMRDSDFGRYAFPQKTYEILACKTPVLAARVGALAQLFQNYPRCLYQPDSVEDLSTKILDLLAHPESVDLPIPTWAEQAEKLAAWLQT
ncbi:glycosyltransferase family 4 protein [Methylomonas sp. HYX-M1]|uniref:glycosyltransferase family 4 protein n=1 Tax=Methylomonas sp. HYX-M1 TaxID=3139307 RepID=UPI00345BE348